VTAKVAISSRRKAPTRANISSAIERALNVAEHDVYPASAVGFRGLATAAGLQHCVRVPGIGEAAEAEQAIAENLRLWMQASLRPLGQGVQREGSDRLDDRTPGTTGVVRFHRDPKKGTDVTNGRLFSEPRPACCRYMPDRTMSRSFPGGRFR
jgi:hypothetical protein